MRAPRVVCFFPDTVVVVHAVIASVFCVHVCQCPRVFVCVCGCVIVCVRTILEGGRRRVWAVSTGHARAPACCRCANRSTLGSVFLPAPRRIGRNSPRSTIPRTTCGPDGQVSNLQRRATELKAKMGKQLVLEAIAEHQYCIGELVSTNSNLSGS